MRAFSAPQSAKTQKEPWLDLTTLREGNTRIPRSVGRRRTGEYNFRNRKVVFDDLDKLIAVADFDKEYLDIEVTENKSDEVGTIAF